SQRSHFAEPLRMVLLGRTGTGRSSSGNTILGRSAFWVESSPCSVTTRCQRQSGTVAGRSISIVDTPGFFHTEMSPQEVLSEVGQCVRLYPPGPHVFLVTLQTARFTQQERETLKWIRALFGPEVSRFTMVLFTCGDRLMDKPIEDFLQESSELFEFVSSCDGRYHVFENTSHDKKTQEQVQKLLEKVDMIVADNGGSCYNNVMFKRAEGALMEAQERILGSEDKTEAAFCSVLKRPGCIVETTTKSRLKP
uniref:AIG1-type G domain-containing protein n=1 Tax=Gouania willdenowi TaxID=441366 RepID=A0A8C5DK91_GOUWI